MDIPHMITVFNDSITRYIPSLIENGYTLFLVETSNADRPDYIMHRVVYQNNAIDRTIYFDLAPRPKDITLDVFIWSDNDRRIPSLTISDYIEYEKTAKELPFSCCFALSEDIFADDIKEHFELVEDLFQHDLHEVILGNKMIHIPVKDPR